MNRNGKSRIPAILEKHESKILAEWIQEQTANGAEEMGLISEEELREQCREFVHLVRQATREGTLEDVMAPQWEPVRELLGEFSRSRGLQGFTPREVAMFIFSFKRPLFAHLRQELAGEADVLFRELTSASELLDSLGLWTTDVNQQARDEMISRQQEEMLELSTPVVKLWDGVLALPMIGTLDSARTQMVMEALLQRIVETGAEVAIIDITGVPTVDTLTAQHLLKTVTAARLMGADCIISGIRPQIAQTIVHLGVDLADIVTKATLADAFAVALKRTGRMVVKQDER